MNKFLLLLFAATLLFSCESDSKSCDNQPKVTAHIVTCPNCNGAGGLQNPYNGQIYVCTGCNGTGQVTIVTENDNNPSFTGGKACTEIVGCDCEGFDPEGAYGSDQFECKHCHHQKKFHHKGRL